MVLNQMLDLNLDDLEIGIILKKDDSINNIYDDINYMESPNMDDIETILNTNPIITKTNTLPITMTNTITNTNNSTITNIHSDSNSEKKNNVYIDILTNNRFKLNDYSYKEGITFHKIYNTQNIEVKTRVICGNSVECYELSADIDRSPEGFKEMDSKLILTKMPANALKKILMAEGHKKDVYYLVFKASERLICFKEVSEEIYGEYIKLKDSELIQLIKEFRELTKSKLYNLKRNKDYPKIAVNILKYGKNLTLDDKDIPKIIMAGIEIGLCNINIHKIYQIQFEDEYNYIDVEKNIKFYKSQGEYGSI